MGKRLWFQALTRNLGLAYAAKQRRDVFRKSFIELASQPFL
jgi:hypothetical protein